MAIYLSKIKIKNFRNFCDLDLTLRPTAVIVGENKVGKTNLLHALRLVLDPSLPDSVRTLKAEDFWDGLKKPFAGNTIEVLVELAGFEGDKEAEAVLSDCVTNINPRVARLTYQFRPRPKISGKGTRESDYEFIIYGGKDEKNRVGGDVRRWISLMVLPALRDAESELENWRRSPLRPLLERLQIDQKSLDSIIESLNKVTRQLVTEKQVAELATEITSRVNEMVGKTHGVDTRLGLASTAADQLLRSIRLFIDGDRSRPLSEGSLGSANVLFLALLVLELDAKRRASESVATILAIEEPEAHLHPHVQRLLFRYFLTREQSVIVTTHSPNIASVAPAQSLVALRATKANGTKGYATGGLNLSDIERDDLQRYLDVTRAEIVFAKGVILVEGTAEQFLVPAFAETLQDDEKRPFNLDRIGVSVCPVFGTDFAPYTKFLGSQGLNIPYVVITDGDHRSTNGAEVYDGIWRGIRLLTDTEAEKKATLQANQGHWREARIILAQNGVFVGRKTLELDLLASFSDQIKATMRELNVSRKVAEAFEKAVDAATKTGGADASVEVMARIERRGKGRFAQRLAAKIKGQKPPGHILHALDLIRQVAQQ